MENFGIKNMNTLISSHGLENSPRSTNDTFSMCSVNSAPKASENEYQEFDEEDLTDEIDKNGDGKITKEELKAYQEKVAKENDDIKGELDKNGDGKITKDEVGSYNPSGASSSSATSGTTPSPSEELQDGLPCSGWTTTDEIDTEKWNVSALEELDGIQYKTNIPSPSTFDPTEDPRGWQYQTKMEKLDNLTQEILNNNSIMKGRSIVSCIDNLDTQIIGEVIYDNGTFTRTIRLNDQTEITIEVRTGDFKPNIKIEEYEGKDKDNPEVGDKINTKSYIDLGDGYYAVKLESVAELVVVKSGNNEEKRWVSNAVTYGDVFVEIYDKKGNKISWDDPKHQELLDKFNEKSANEIVW